MAEEWLITPDGPYWLLTGPECYAVFKRKEDAERDIQRMTAFRRAVVIHPTGEGKKNKGNGNDTTTKIPRQRRKAEGV